jgi:hypothetical protein
MLVQEEREDVYFNFVSSIDSEVTRKTYEYLMSKFLKYCNLDLGSLLRLSQQDLSNLIIKYLVSQKILSQYKNQIFAAMRHACEMNDVTLNWKKLKKFIRSEKPNNL